MISFDDTNHIWINLNIVGKIILLNQLFFLLHLFTLHSALRRRSRLIGIWWECVLCDRAIKMKWKLEWRTRSGFHLDESQDISASKWWMQLTNYCLKIILPLRNRYVLLVMGIFHGWCAWQLGPIDDKWNSLWEELNNFWNKSDIDLNDFVVFYERVGFCCCCFFLDHFICDDIKTCWFALAIEWFKAIRKFGWWWRRSSISIKMKYERHKIMNNRLSIVEQKQIKKKKKI